MIHWWGLNLHNHSFLYIFWHCFIENSKYLLTFLFLYQREVPKGAYGTGQLRLWVLFLSPLQRANSNHWLLCIRQQRRPLRYSTPSCCIVLYLNHKKCKLKNDKILLLRNYEKEGWWDRVVMGMIRPAACRVEEGGCG